MTHFAITVYLFSLSLAGTVLDVVFAGGPSTLQRPGQRMKPEQHDVSGDFQRFLDSAAIEVYVATAVIAEGIGRATTVPR